MERLSGLRSGIRTACTWPPQRVQLLLFSRLLRHQAFDAAFDQDQLAEARKWRQSFQPSSLPEGNTTFARSSGPGGQHVNKLVHHLIWPYKVSKKSHVLTMTMTRTETKATTVWPVSKLFAVLPKIMHSGIRSSKYYSQRNDSLMFQAQTQRSRTANADENRQKLFDELKSLYERTVPGETSVDKTRKYEAL